MKSRSFAAATWVVLGVAALVSRGLGVGETGAAQAQVLNTQHDAATTPAAPSAASGAKARAASLSWVRLAGADACVATRDLAVAVESRLGQRVFVSAAAAELSVEGHVEHGARGFRAAITVRDAQGTSLGERQFSAARCDELTAPLALSVALMIDPDAVARQAAREAVDPDAGLNDAAAPADATSLAADAGVDAQGDAGGDASVAGEPKPRATDRWAFDGALSFGAGLGVLPNPGIGLFGSGLLAPPGPFALYGGVSAMALQEMQVSAATARLSSAWLTGGFCPWVLRSRRAFAFGCGVAELGLMIALADSSVALSHDVRPTLGFGGVAGVSFLLGGPFTFRVTGSLSGVVSRPPIRARQTQPGLFGTDVELYSLAPVQATLHGGFGLHFE